MYKKSWRLYEKNLWKTINEASAFQTFIQTLTQINWEPC